MLLHVQCSGHWLHFGVDNIIDSCSSANDQAATALAGAYAAGDRVAVQFQRPYQKFYGTVKLVASAHCVTIAFDDGETWKIDPRKNHVAALHVHVHSPRQGAAAAAAGVVQDLVVQQQRGTRTGDGEARPRSANDDTATGAVAQAEQQAEAALSAFATLIPVQWAEHQRQVDTHANRATAEAEAEVQKQLTAYVQYQAATTDDGASSSSDSEEGGDSGAIVGDSRAMISWHVHRARRQQQQLLQSPGYPRLLPGAHAKKSWSQDEDDMLIKLVAKHGPKIWSLIAESLPGRVGKQCRER